MAWFPEVGYAVEVKSLVVRESGERNAMPESTEKFLKFDEYLAWYHEEIGSKPELEKGYPIIVIGTVDDLIHGKMAQVTQKNSGWGQVAALIPIRFITDKL